MYKSENVQCPVDSRSAVQGRGRLVIAAGLAIAAIAVVFPARQSSAAPAARPQVVYPDRTDASGPLRDIVPDMDATMQNDIILATLLASPAVELHGPKYLSASSSLARGTSHPPSPGLPAHSVHCRICTNR